MLASVTYPAYGGHSDPAVTYTYDATGAMASETDWLGNEVTFAHDADGNPTAQANAVSHLESERHQLDSVRLRRGRQRDHGQLDPQPDLRGQRDPDPVLLGSTGVRATPTAS